MAMVVNWIQDARHTQTPEVEIAGILSDHGYSNGTIGMAGLADITTYALMSGLGKLAPGATLVDATRPLRRCPNKEESRGDGEPPGDLEDSRAGVPQP